MVYLLEAPDQVVSQAENLNPELGGLTFCEHYRAVRAVKIERREERYCRRAKVKVLFTMGVGILDYALREDEGDRVLNALLTATIVKFFDERKNYGFIEPAESGEEDHFVHRSDIESGTLDEGDVVEFDSEMGDRGP